MQNYECFMKYTYFKSFWRILFDVIKHIYCIKLYKNNVNVDNCSVWVQKLHD